MNSLAKFFFVSAAAAFLTSCASHRNSGWIFLFDGKSTDAFRGYKTDKFPSDSWTVENGTLKAVAGENVTDLITREKFESFELQFDWRMSPGGNSGVIFHVTEDFERPWHTGPEMQLLDDEKSGDGKNPKTATGALYALIGATNKFLKPVGQWNHSGLIINGHHGEHWLNGKKVVEYELGSPELTDLIAKSKFKNMKRFAKEPTGYIDFQNHHHEVWFRNIKVRRL